MRFRLLATALLVVAALVCAGATEASVARAGAAALAAAGPASAADDADRVPTGIDDDPDRPEGNAWIVGVVVFILAVVLVSGGRWWVRNRVGRVQR